MLTVCFSRQVPSLRYFTLVMVIVRRTWPWEQDGIGKLSEARPYLAAQRRGRGPRWATRPQAEAPSASRRPPRSGAQTPASPETRPAQSQTCARRTSRSDAAAPPCIRQRVPLTEYCNSGHHPQISGSQLILAVGKNIHAFTLDVLSARSSPLLPSSFERFTVQMSTQAEVDVRCLP